MSESDFLLELQSEMAWDGMLRWVLFEEDSTPDERIGQLDAIDRAARLGSDAAAWEAVNRAAARGDTVLVKAILLRSLIRKWPRVTASGSFYARRQRGPSDGH